MKANMTQDEINQMVEQAGFHGMLSIGVVMDSKQLEALLELATAKEREACAKVCEDGLNIATCLNALDDMEMWGEKFAKAIRARGEA
jgi:intracellular sulfur oxidation DsrE/DsrF family protein